MKIKFYFIEIPIHTRYYLVIIWVSFSFFSAHPTKKMVVKRLVKDGRLEMTTGGWVMTDEATCHIYAMLDQLIEGK